jgi:uncharacterized membrane protein YphA (DoxX/SURF4 family)
VRLVPVTAAAAPRQPGFRFSTAEPNGAVPTVLDSLRAAVGLAFLVSGAAFAVRHDAYALAFARWNVPFPDLTVWIVGALEIVCGTLLTLGVLTRPVSLLLATLMIGAAATAGRVDGGARLVLPIVTFALCSFFAWSADRVAVSGPKRPPGVQ